MKKIYSDTAFFLGALLIGATMAMADPILPPEGRADQCEKALLTTGPSKGTEEGALERLWSRVKAVVGNAAADMFGKRIYLVRLSEIKSLNEKHLGMGLTEEFLQHVEGQLHRYLAVDNRGVVIALNYKSFFIRADLDPEGFEKQVFTLLKADAYHWYKDRLDSGDLRLPEEPITLPNWESFLESHFNYEVGESMVDSALRYNISELYRSYGIGPLTVEEWRRELIELREEIHPLMLDSTLNWRILLYNIRKMIRDGTSEKDVADWVFGELVMANVGGIDKEATRLDLLDLAKQLVYYQHLLVQAEFLPVFTGINNGLEFTDVNQMSNEEFSSLPWTFRRQMALEKSKDAEYVLAFDGIGFGAENIRAMDKWVANGAHLDELESSLKDTAQILRKSQDFIFETIRDFLPRSERKKAQLYRSGDDGLIFLPDMADDVRWAIESVIENFNERYADEMIFAPKEEPVRYRFSTLEPINRRQGQWSINFAIDKVRGMLNSDESK